MHVRPRLLVASALLTAALTACNGQGTQPGAASGSPSTTDSATPSASVSAAPSPAPSSSSSPAGSPEAPGPTPAPTRTSAPPAPPVPTYFSIVATQGGRLGLIRGGPAQEFTVTLRNGNTHAYGHLLLAFQMEPLLSVPGDAPGSGPEFVLERRDPATGAWRPVPLRIATDQMPYAMYEGGSPLVRDAVRTERFRLRATATGATGDTPLMVYAIDTDAPEGSPDAVGRPGYSYLPQTTRRP